VVKGQSVAVYRVQVNNDTAFASPKVKAKAGSSTYTIPAAALRISGASYRLWLPLARK
jgi:hypothetical protein